MQINFLQPIYNLTFSNSLVACVVFMGVGAMCEIGFILGNPWTSIIIAIFAECGTFVTLVLGVHLGLTPPEAAAVASIGGADGPMVLFTSLMLAPHLFVPISVIAYLYLSLTYAGYPWLLKMLVPKALRGKDIMFYAPEVPKSKKFIFILVCCALLCLLLPMAAPLIMSFFLGMAIKEAEIVPYQDLIENTLLYTGTLMLGLLLGTLCEASTLLNPKVAPLIVLVQLVSWAVTLFTGSRKATSTRLLVLPAYPAYRPLLKLLSMLLRMKIRLQSFCLLLWALTSAALSYPLSLAAYSSQPLAWLNN